MSKIKRIGLAFFYIETNKKLLEIYPKYKIDQTITDFTLVFSVNVISREESKVFIEVLRQANELAERLLTKTRGINVSDFYREELGKM